jgi:hypothetical protein
VGYGLAGDAGDSIPRSKTLNPDRYFIRPKIYRQILSPIDKVIPRYIIYSKPYNHI